MEWKLPDFPRKNGNKVKIRKQKQNVAKRKRKCNNVFRWNTHGNGSMNVKLPIFTMATRGGVKMALPSLSERLPQWVLGVLIAEGEKDLN